MLHSVAAALELGGRLLTEQRVVGRLRLLRAGGAPALRAFTIACGGAGAGGTAQDAAGQSGAVGGYELSVCAGGVAITSASACGAANALSTLAQLLRYDTELRTHVIDFVPLQIRDQPELGWRGWTSGGAVIQHWHSLLRP